ncbi:hypothetical protein Rsub_06051 [Raphidocelis subcapitata]|uniref:F-box domain-containing protein n=1 Tax=Raphidocelis subcapitata TaxID=307507 RepID=A0A2V0P174_9CHLO|nr:hypothetical protein Rsub_06051 [Raphidocelis subcapitata]|eukprot:GBF93319.1 hypothetical protein Rsub_06051 [Raphidocelis subcapitata]
MAAALAPPGAAPVAAGAAALPPASNAPAPASNAPTAFPLLDLPPCVLARVVGSGGIEEQAQWATVCGALKAAAEASLSRRVGWACTEAEGASDERIATALGFLSSHCPRLKRVAVVGPREAPAAAAAADPAAAAADPAAAPAAPAGPLPAALRRLAGGCRTLAHVALVNVDVGDAELRALAGSCGSLRGVALGRTNGAARGGGATDAGLAALAAGCPLLQGLALLRCAAVTDAGLAAFSSSRALRALTLHLCPRVTAAGLVAFASAHAERLRRLDLAPGDERGAPVPSFFDAAAAAAVAARCAALRSLRVSEQHLARPALDDGALATVVRGCGALSEVDLSCVEAGDGLLCALAASAAGALRVLRLDRTLACDEGLAAVAAACGGLQELRVVGLCPHVYSLPVERGVPGMTEAGLRAVSAHCRALTALEVSALAPDPAAQPPADAAAGQGAGAGGAGGPDGERDEGEAADPFAAQLPPPPPPLPPLPRAPLLPAASCAALSRLSLDWLKMEPGRVQGALAATLAECSGLARLSLAGYQGDVAELLSALASAGAPLAHAGLQHSRATDAALAALPAAFGRTLASLRLAYCRAITDTGLAAAGKLPKLASLDLYQVPSVSPAAVAGLVGSMPALRELWLGHHTGACARGAAAGGGAGHHRFGSAGARGPGAGAHLAPVRAAADARRGRRVRVLVRAPEEDEGGFEARTLARLAGA